MQKNSQGRGASSRIAVGLNEKPSALGSYPFFEDLSRQRRGGGAGGRNGSFVHEGGVSQNERVGEYQNRIANGPDDVLSAKLPGGAQLLLDLVGMTWYNWMTCSYSNSG